MGSRTILVSVSSVSDPVLVGITTAELCSRERATTTPESEPPQRKLMLGMDYVAAVSGAGGIPLVIPPMSLADEILIGRLDALVVSGGPDVDPALYDEGPHEHLGPIDPDTDARELQVVQAADAREIPILAICRGMQLVNVARGGRLWQDLPTERPSEVIHRQMDPGTAMTHSVTVDGDSLLAELTYGEHHHMRHVLPVNSFHHQAVRTLGHDLRITARAEDDVVEAYEATDRPFLVGVQWHAESLVHDPRHAALFSGLVTAARRQRVEAAASG
jgi:putative glutamine amidotransferase